MKPRQNSAGVVWSWLGWMTLVVMVALLGWARVEAVSPTSMRVLAGLGSSLTALLLFIALVTGFHGRRKLLTAESQPVSSKGSRLALAGLACLAIIDSVVGLDSYLRLRQEQKCVAEAEAAVEAHFQRNLEPAAMARLGTFQDMTGEGYFYPLWNIQGYHYLTANRIAQFANVSVPVRIYVREGGKINPSNQEVVIDGVDFNVYHTLYVYVSHPALRE